MTSFEVVTVKMRDKQNIGGGGQKRQGGSNDFRPGHKISGYFKFR